MPSTFARTVMLAAPSVAMAVVGAALFGPGAARSFEAARVFGGPTEGVPRLSFRIEVTRRFRGIDGIVAGKSIDARATANGRTASAHCVTGVDGICDVELPLETPASGTIDVLVGSGGSELAPLARGTVENGVARFTRRPPHPPEIAGARKGELDVRLFAVRGVFAAPFPDELAITAAGHAGEMRGPVDITVNLVGGDIAAERDGDSQLGEGASESPSASATSDERGVTRWIAIPRAHAVEVNVEAKAGGAYGTFAGALPVVPGALWLDPRSRGDGRLRVVSPVPRPRAYAILASRTARLWSGTIALEEDARGFASGAVAWPDVKWPSGELVWLTLAGDPEGTGVGTVGWPIPAAGHAAEPMAEQSFADALLLDGMPAAEERENARRRHAAWLVAAALAATAGLEAALVLSSARSQGKGGVGRVAAALAAIVLAFAAIGIVAMWKAAG